MLIKDPDVFLLSETNWEYKSRETVPLGNVLLLQRSSFFGTKIEIKFDLVYCLPSFIITNSIATLYEEKY